MKENIAVTRRRGKKRRTWTSDVTDWCGMSYTECVRVVESREEWRSMWQPIFCEEDGTRSVSENVQSS